MGTRNKEVLVITFNVEFLKLQEKNKEKDTAKAYGRSTKWAEFPKYIAHVIREESENDLKNQLPL